MSGDDKICSKGALGRCLWRGCAAAGLGAIVMFLAFYGLSRATNVADPAGTSASAIVFPANDEELARMTDKIMTDDNFASVSHGNLEDTEPAAGE